MVVVQQQQHGAGWVFVCQELVAADNEKVQMLTVMLTVMLTGNADGDCERPWVPRRALIEVRERPGVPRRVSVVDGLQLVVIIGVVYFRSAFFLVV